MSTMNTEVIKTKMPGAIDGIMDRLNKLETMAATAEEIAAQVNVPQVTEDAKALRVAADALKSIVAKFVGEEGDKISESGTLWGFVGTAKAIEAGMGV